MPYIPLDENPKYKVPLATLKEQPQDRIDGELNYIITRILRETYPPTLPHHQLHHRRPRGL